MQPLIITGFMMSRVGGLELMRQLRESGSKRPIIPASPIPEANLPERSGCDAFLQEPYREADLLTLMARMGAQD